MPANVDTVIVDGKVITVEEIKDLANLPGKEEHISVFLPCAPNPTTGFFFYVPRSKIIEVDMSTEDAATVRVAESRRLRAT